MSLGAARSTAEGPVAQNPVGLVQVSLLWYLVDTLDHLTIIDFLCEASLLQRDAVQ